MKLARLLAVVLAVGAGCWLSPIGAAETSHDHDIVEPAGLMGGHLHPAGEWMVSYKTMVMHMTDNRDSRHDVRTAEVLWDWMVAPKSMTMTTHMLGMMYAPSDEVTLMVMIPWHFREMTHLNRAHVDFTTRSEGLGDISVTALVKGWGDHNHHLHWNLGLSLPTGSIDEKDDAFRQPRSRLPYPMQLGSGTVDLKPGVTYAGNHADWSWGAQALVTIRTRENRHDYQLGNEYESSLWLGRRVSQRFGVTGRLRWRLWEDIHGQDIRLNPRMVPTANPDRRGGKRVDALLGARYRVDNMEWSLEGGSPIHEDLDGPQLSTQYVVAADWTWEF